MNKINNQQNNAVVYNVNTEGAIIINSIQDKSIFDYAQKCDKNDDKLLEHNEINEFLKEYSPINKKIQYSIYYEQKNSKGEITKKSMLMNSDKSQVTYFYKNGQPQYCILKMQNGEKHILNFKQGKARYYNNPQYPDYYKQYALSKENLERFMRLGQGKPLDFSNPIEEFLYRLFNWDW